MTPFEIKILLHYFTNCDDPIQVQRNPPVWIETRDRLLSEGLIREAVGDERKYGATWAITKRGQAHCEALMAVPLPESVWVTKYPAS